MKIINNDRKKKIDIICFSSSDWHGRWGSRQQVMQRLAARGYRILFVERQVGLEHLWRYPDIRRRKWDRWKEGLREITENLWIISFPPLLPGRYYSLTVARLNQLLVNHWIQLYLRLLEIEDPILWLYRPEDGNLIGHFGERLAVYHCIDEFTANTHGRKRRIITTLEKNTLRKVDLVFANSLLTYQNKFLDNPHTYHIPSGADVKLFSKVLHEKTSVHPDIADLPHPIAGYIGNINEKLNIPLLASTAANLPNWQFVFVGQLYLKPTDSRPLQRQSNTHFLGRYPFEDIPSLIKGMDICLLPYTDTEFARYRSPLKLYEYLAAGKAIVSTNHPEVQEFSQWVNIAASSDDFVSAILHAYQHDSPESQSRRSRIAEAHSWDRRVDKMEQILTSYIQQI